MNEHRQFQPLEKDFYNKSTIKLAKALLGNILVNETADGVMAGMIVETEAYLGTVDRAAHSYGNRRTKRTEIMYHQAGLVYTYQMHTHCLLNIVSGEINQPEAILIRAIEPYMGVDLMLERRPVPKLGNLTSGPGKLTKAMGITMADYGHSIFEPPLYIAEGMEVKQIKEGPRIGISNTGEARDYPYRFWIEDNPFVSR